MKTFLRIGLITILFSNCTHYSDQKEGATMLQEDSILSLHTSASLPEKTLNPTHQAKSLQNKDTLYYEVKSDAAEIEAYAQTLKVSFLSDTSIWFEVDYNNVLGSGKVTGVATNQYSDMDYEIEEFEETASPALEYSMEKDKFKYSIKIQYSDSSMARIFTSSEIPTDQIPFEATMKLKQAK
ncbi:hypothetical protein SAMN05421823_112162 [Catalinimonas alkaloidigena]|uniref:Uncharacterized protein n=1 Tax=Catalinimonas alkaloidigena TaxID=1075417 RepID=A0A1G9SH53_9BACT|nr:hypothetical protein [Catalinimonas alkaloidigena]SDM34759.1 hypothetical protein SAMN05421823_112162 [Catalinimonas alkaloidigena]